MKEIKISEVISEEVPFFKIMADIKEAVFMAEHNKHIQQYFNKLLCMLRKTQNYTAFSTEFFISEMGFKAGTRAWHLLENNKDLIKIGHYYYFADCVY
jgi:hypothetical protein